MDNKKVIVAASVGLLFVTSALVANAASLKGKILLQVEQNGEAWYVSPVTEERTYMGRPDDAFLVMREQGIGITNANIAKIAVGDKNLNTSTDTDGDGLSDVIENALGTNVNATDTDGDGKDDKVEVLNGYSPTSSGETYLIDKTFAAKQVGKILLQVEQNGEAWYVNPDDSKRYFLGKPSDAFNIMKSLGLGISDTNLKKISTRSTQKATTTSQVKNQSVTTNSCDNKSAGDSCTFTGKDSESVTGTCTSKDDKLVCFVEGAEGSQVLKPTTGQTGAQTDDTLPSGTQKGPDLAATAKILGITEVELKAALGEAGQSAPDFAAVATKLGITEAELKAALGEPKNNQQ